MALLGNNRGEKSQLGMLIWLRIRISAATPRTERWLARRSGVTGSAIKRRTWFCTSSPAESMSGNGRVLRSYHAPEGRALLCALPCLGRELPNGSRSICEAEMLAVSARLRYAP